MQRVAASAPGGPLLIVAGPGTGKTRTLTHRIAYLCAELDVYPEQCLAITFTRRAAEELRHRLDGPARAGRRGRDGVDVPRARPVDPAGERGGGRAVASTSGSPRTPSGWPWSPRRPGSVRRRRSATPAARSAALDTDEVLREEYLKALRTRDLVDLDELVALPVMLLARRRPWSTATASAGSGSSSTSTRTSTRRSTSCCGCSARPTATSARSATPTRRSTRSVARTCSSSCGSRPTSPTPAPVRLTRNYRSSAPILAAAVQAIAPTSLVPGRRLDPARVDPDAPQVGALRAPPRSPTRPSSSCVRSTSWSAGCRTGRSIPAGGLPSLVGSGAVLLRHRRALPHRRAGRPDRRRAVAGRHPGAEALARPAAWTGAGWPRSPASCASPPASTGRSPRGSGWRAGPRRPLRPAGARRGGAGTRRHLLAVELLTPLAARCGDDLERFLGRAGHRRRGRRVGSARRPGRRC